MFKEQHSEQARAYFAEAIELRPGLSDDRRDQGKRYHAYAQYAVAKDMLKDRRFDEAQAAFEALLGATGDAIKLLTPEQIISAKSYLKQCVASRGVTGISTVQDWVDAFKLQKLTPMLEEMGAEANEEVGIMLELEDEDVQSLRAALPKVKQKKFDKGLLALQQHADPEVNPTYLLPDQTAVMSDQTESMLGRRTRRGPGVGAARGQRLLAARRWRSRGRHWRALEPGKGPSCASTTTTNSGRGSSRRRSRCTCRAAWGSSSTRRPTRRTRGCSTRCSGSGCQYRVHVFIRHCV